MRMRVCVCACACGSVCVRACMWACVRMCVTALVKLTRANLGLSKSAPEASRQKTYEAPKQQQLQQVGRWTAHRCLERDRDFAGRRWG
jgi:hypothetical protein